MSCYFSLTDPNHGIYQQKKKKKQSPASSKLWIKRVNCHTSFIITSQFHTKFD
jgi:hypothetical protein